MTNMTGSKLSISSHTGKITGYWITTRSFPYRDPYWPGPYWPGARANMGLDFVSSQYGCLFSRCRKYVIHTWAFPYWGSRDDNQANMEMPMN